MTQTCVVKSSLQHDIAGVGAHLSLIARGLERPYDPVALLSNLERAAGELQEVIDGVRA